MATAMKIQTISLSSINPDPEQPRKTFSGIPELAASIKSKGLNNPIHVRLDPAHKGGYLVVNGQRRFMAALEAGLEKIPAIIMVGKESGEIFLNQILDNAAREDLSTMEEADAFLTAQTLHRISAAEIAEAASRTEKYVKDAIALAGIHEKLRPLVETGEIPKSIAVRIAQEIPENKQVKAWELASKAGSVKARMKKLDAYAAVLNQEEIPGGGVGEPGEPKSPDTQKAEKAAMSRFCSFAEQFEKDLDGLSVKSAVLGSKKNKKKLADAAAMLKKRLKEIEDALLDLEATI